jgi:hypothetical protein
MKSNWFIVIEARSAWWIDNEGAQFGPFPNSDEARAEAITIARKFRDPKRRSLIFSPDERGKPQLVWEDDDD